MTNSPTFEDETAPVDERVTDLLRRMTLAEKAGQLVGIFSSEKQIDLYESHTLQDVEHLIRERGIGSVTPFATGFSSHNSPAVVPRIANRLQRVAREETRLGIPLLIPVDAVHGHANVKGATIFPHNLGMAATWNPDLVRGVGRATAIEMRATGATMNYSPNVDVARDPRWGRTYETYGESSHLVGELAAAEIKGLQGAPTSDDGRTNSTFSLDDAVAATAKHFPAYSSPVGGEDGAPNDIPMSTLRRVFIPPFKQAIQASTAAVMPSYSSVAGEPVHGSRRFLTTLLREELGFDGIVASDWHGVAFLANQHRTSPSLSAATVQAISAGLDVASIGGPGYADRLVEAVESGAISKGRLNQSVRRVLALKFRLGLFDDPYVDLGRRVGQSDHRELSRQSARESVILAKNDGGTLPLPDDCDQVLVTGPNADSLDPLCGGWTVSDLSSSHGTTVRAGVETATNEETTVTFEPGTAANGEYNSDTVELVESAASAAAESDAAIVVCGEGWYVHEFGPETIAGPTGQFPTRTDLGLPTAQTKLLERVAETGTPTVLVVVSGRPLAIPAEVELADAVLLTFYPGYEGGAAIGEILTGETNPSGKLPISMPKSEGHLPTVHDHRPHPRPLGDDEHPPSYDPVFAFGHGLSYAEFRYDSITCSSERIKSDEGVEVTVSVENRSNRPGTEIVQLYLRDVVSSWVTPVQELKGFQRVSIPAGGQTDVTFTLDPSDLAVSKPDGSAVVEPGRFEVLCGGLSTSFSVSE